MKRVLWLLPVPLAAVVVASLSRTPERAEAPDVASTAPQRAQPAAETWVTTTMPPRPSRAALVVAPGTAAAGPKPMTEARTALQESRVPVVAPLSIDQLGTPRERLFAATHGPSQARQAQLDHLSDRAASHLEHLRELRAHATTPEERTHLDQSIARVEKNQSYRARIVKSTVRSPARPGTSIAGLALPTTNDKPGEH